MCTVSIIVRTKDRNLLLQRAIQSVLNQTFTDWEIIIVNNGGSLEELETAIRRYIALLNDKIKVVHLNQSSFMEVATNAGITNSAGAYITLLDDDDTWDNSFLLKCISILQTQQVDAVATQSTLIYESMEDGTVQQREAQPFNPKFSNVTLVKLARRNLFTTNAFMYKKEALRKCGGYREDLPVLGDWEFNLRFALHNKIYVIPEPLAYYHKRIQINQEVTYNNTQLKDHLLFDRKIRNEYLLKGFRREIPFYFGTLIYGYSYVNHLKRLIKRVLKVR